MTIERLYKNATYGKRLEILRIANGWSQEEAANRCGTTKKNYWTWETDKSLPRRNSQKAISAAFNAPISEIFG